MYSRTCTGWFKFRSFYGIPNVWATANSISTHFGRWYCAHSKFFTHNPTTNTMYWRAQQWNMDGIQNGRRQHRQNSTPAPSNTWKANSVYALFPLLCRHGQNRFITFQWHTTWETPPYRWQSFLANQGRHWRYKQRLLYIHRKVSMHACTKDKSVHIIMQIYVYAFKLL